MGLIKTNTQNGDLYPSCFSRPEELNEQVRELLTTLYNSKHRTEKLLAGLINHCFTARTDAVLVSRSILQNVVDTDENIAPKFVIAQRDYVGFGRLCNESGAMEILYKGRKGRAGIAGLNCLNGPLKQLLALTPEECGAVDKRLELYRSSQ